MADRRHTLGIEAELAVATWLSASGWTILARRQRSAAGGEVDLIALDPSETLVAVEVRARMTRRTGGGPDTLDARRIGRIGRTLAAFAAECSTRHTGLRIDLVSLEPMPGMPKRWRVCRLANAG
jgi:Holliday junction resolvase-like predicted endonuclease